MKKLSPQQKRVAEVAAVAGLVLLVVMLAHRQSQANAATGTADPGATGTAVPTSTGGAPADFSGDGTGDLSDFTSTISGSLGDLGTGLAQLGTNQQELSGGEQDILTGLGTLSGSLATTQQGLDDLTTRLQSGEFTPATNGIPGPAAAPGRAAAKPAPAKAATKTVIKASAAHGGKPYVYHVTPGHKPVPVRPATHAVSHSTTPHRSPSQKPAPAHKAAPKRKPAPKKKGRR